LISDLASRDPKSVRIVVRGVNWLGDAVMTTPALMRLREKFPEAHIALLTPQKLKDLWQGHPAVNKVLAIGPNEGLFSASRKLRRGNFDLALVLPNSPRSAMESWLAGIPERIGYARPWRNFFLTVAVPPRADAVKMHKRSTTEIRELISRAPSPRAAGGAPSTKAHQIHEYLHLAAQLGASAELCAPLLVTAASDILAVRQKFGLRETDSPVFGLNPGAEYGPAKRWPVERFIAVAREIQQRTNCVWLIFGGKADLILANEIESAIQSQQFNVRNLAGRTSLRELCAVLGMCRAVLTNDTGPMHVAAALGVPVIVPFGSTSPELTGPGLPADPRNHLLKSNVPCSPCFLRECPIDLRCMSSISVDAVVAAMLTASRQII
jgi:heptosyltransferase-2